MRHDAHIAYRLGSTLVLGALLAVGCTSTQSPAGYSVGAAGAAGTPDDSGDAGATGAAGSGGMTGAAGGGGGAGNAGGTSGSGGVGGTETGGTTGVAGAAGATGLAGTGGLAGSAGAAGTAGGTTGGSGGTTGVAGSTGIAGAAAGTAGGTAGATAGSGGSAGAAGTTGVAGSTGAAGAAGSAGVAGAAGSGAAGTAGVAGAAGSTGVAGAAGSGAAGTAGAAGAAGSTGVAGAAGSGAAGTAGAAGAAGSTGVAGAAGAAGGAGSTGAAGAAAGSGGNSGAAGAAGAAAGRGGSMGAAGATACTLNPAHTNSGSFTYYYLGQRQPSEPPGYRTACGYYATASGMVDTVENVANTAPAKNSYFAAIPGQNNFDSKSNCGACVQITGPNGKTIIATVIDECPYGSDGDNPPCANNPTGHLDLSYDAFQQLGYNRGDPTNTSWRIVPCPVAGNVKVRFKQGNNNEIFIENGATSFTSVSINGLPATRQKYGAWHIDGAILLPAAIHTVDRYGRTVDFMLNSDSTANQDTGQRSPTCQ